MSESKATEAVEGDSGVFESLNQWLLSLPAERKAILQEDKWMLAEAAFAAGRAIGRQEVDHLIKYSYVALREKDDTTWGGQYFEASGCGYAHEKSLGNAYHAKSVERLHAAMVNQLCGGGGMAQAIGRYSILKIARNKVVEVVASGVVPIALQAVQWREVKPIPRDLITSIYMRMTPWLTDVARTRSSADDIGWAWGYVCAASEVLEVELPGRRSDATDVRAEITDALKKLGEAIKNSESATAGAVELGRLAAAVVLIAENAGVLLKARGFIKASAG